MNPAPDSRSTRASTRPATRRLTRALAAIALAVVLGTGATVALAASATLNATHNSQLRHTILVNAQGHTVYALSPETTHHLLCKSGECLAVWPPLTVPRASSLRAGSGVHGHLGVLRRGSKLQVTLNGMPLYVYSGDTRRSEANGEGIRSFGGTWHAVLSSGHPA
jgi:predicted lipoprotein with Yx(FWY)xxD motif